MRALLPLLVAGTVLFLAACGGSGDKPEDQVRSVMRDLQKVQTGGDAELACDDVYVVREPWEIGRGESESEGESERERERGEEGEGEVEAGDCERAVGQVLRA